MDGNFQTKCLADFDGNGFDDIVIYNEMGSVGIVSDAASYHDVWHVDDPSSNPWSLLGAGTFDPSIGQDSILFKHTGNGHLYLWDNQGSDVGTWNWKQTDIGYLADGWEFAAIGDYDGDGREDLLLREYDSGWGGLGYCSAGDCSGWTELNAAIETNQNSNYIIVA